MDATFLIAFFISFSPWANLKTFLLVENTFKLMFLMLMGYLHEVVLLLTFEVIKFFNKQKLSTSSCFQKLIKL